MTNAELEKVLHSDTATGLSEAEAARRLRRKKNTVWRLKVTSVKKYAAKSFMEFTTVLLIAAVITVSYTHLDVYKRQAQSRHKQI